MAAIPPLRISRHYLATGNRDVIRPCLVPFTQCANKGPAARFSTSRPLCKKDNNSNRGLSAVRGTGVRPRQTLSVKQKDFAKQRLPKPVEITEKITGSPDHGLWDFFKDKKLLQTPVEEQRHGRSWTIGELRQHDFESLHQLWWVCVKERNRLATEKIERNRLEAGYGDRENEERDKTVQETMKAILDTLSERQLAYREALVLAKQDPDVDLSRRDGPQYVQQLYDPLEEEERSTEVVQEPANASPAKEHALPLPDGRPKEKMNFA